MVWELGEGGQEVILGNILVTEKSFVFPASCVRVLWQLVVLWLERGAASNRSGQLGEGEQQQQQLHQDVGQDKELDQDGEQEDNHELEVAGAWEAVERVLRQILEMQGWVAVEEGEQSLLLDGGEPKLRERLEEVVSRLERKERRGHERRRPRPQSCIM